MPKSWSAKDERQYKAIVRSCTKEAHEKGANMKKRIPRCKGMAAAIVNKRRGIEGRTKTKTPWNLLLNAMVAKKLPPFNPKRFGVRRATKKECLYKSGKKKGYAKPSCVWGWGKYRGKLFTKRS